MRIVYEDGIRTLYLSDQARREAHVDDGFALLHIFRLLSGSHSHRDRTIFHRQIG